MKVRFDPGLMRELVQAEALKDRAFWEECRKRLEPVYELPLEERAPAFAAVYRDLFEERGLGSTVEAILREFPALEELEVLVFKVLNRKEEGADLSPDKKRVGLRLRPERLNGAQSAPFLRHELRHVADMLDDSFAYKRERVGGTPAEEFAIRERYHLLWDVYIDGRLSRQGKETEATLEERLGEFERAFSFLSMEERRRAFEALWGGEGITHPRLLELAKEPWRLRELLGGKATLPRKPIPGSLCPLCRFPTYNWVEPEEKTILVVQAHFPNWAPEQGICERCNEIYSMEVRR